MRWGIRNEAQDDHMTTEICLREIELCKKQSTGPCFMVTCFVIFYLDIHMYSNMYRGDKLHNPYQ